MGRVDLLAIDLLVAAALAWLAIGLAGLARPRALRWIAHGLFPAGAAIGLAVGAIGFASIGDTPQGMVSPLGLPDLPFHLRLDALSAFFLGVLGVAASGISIYAAGYFRRGEGTLPGMLCLYYHVFLASMAFVLLADDAYFFMVAWETMALSSFFLVVADHRHAVVRRAGYLYLLIAHVGAISILLCFGVLQGGTGDYTFAGMRALAREGTWATAAFALAALGFGAKAGLLPLHVWLPEAHPAAPSPVSALMSGVMLKTAVYGALRVVFDLLGPVQWWWGIVLLGVGLVTALFGVIYSAVQSDMKRLLAYSSIENLGLVFAGVGLALTFSAFGMRFLAGLALAAALLHCLNHALFKSLLFLCTGAVLHATGERNLGRLGGLIRFMPWVAWLALLAALASAGLPPLNGFVSEWLLLQAFLFTPGLPRGYISMLVPVAAAAVALVAALSGYVMVKFFGVIFLGQPREAKLAEAHDANVYEKIGLAWLAAGCVAIGLFPVPVLLQVDAVTSGLVGASLHEYYQAGGWLLLAPVSAARASYGPLLLAVALAVVGAAVVLGVRRLGHPPDRRAPAWDCGFPLQTARMQDTAEGFGQPIRQVFEPFFLMQRELPSPFDRAPRYRVVVEDPSWRWLYAPVARAAAFGARLVAVLQQGRIAVYLLYSFLTLLGLLFLLR